MSWLFSQALVEEYLVENSLDGGQSAPLSGSHTQQAYCAPDKMTDFSRLSRFGMTYKPLTESRGEELLTLYRVGFPVRTFQPQEVEMDLMESAAGCGEKWRASFTKFNPDLCLWKTHQCSLLEDLESFLETWPQWGLMQNGECWEQIPQVFHITEPEFGWLPTPVASDWKGGCKAIRKDKGIPRTDAIRHYIKTKFDITYPAPNFLESLMEWPVEWTGLKPLGMDKFQQWQQQHGES
jgi:hypothetical protein